MTITTDGLLHSSGLRLGVGADWTFLHDTERIIQKDLDIAEYTDPQSNPMIPHTFVLEPRLRIYKIYNGYWYWGRPSVANAILRSAPVQKTISIGGRWDFMKDVALKLQYDYTRLGAGSGGPADLIGNRTFSSAAP